MNYWVLIYRMAWVVLIVLCIIGLTCIFVPKGRQYRDLQNKKAVLEEDNARIEASIKQLQTQQELFQTDSNFVERTAREMGMAKPGETVFKLTHTTSAPSARDVRR